MRTIRSEHKLTMQVRSVGDRRGPFVCPSGRARPGGEPRPIQRASSQDGQAIVEAAITLMMFLVFIFGIFEGGRMIQVQQTLTDAARLGAKRKVLPLTMTQILPLDADVELNYVKPFLRAASLDDTQATVAIASVTIAGETYSQVTVTYPYRVMTLPRVFGFMNNMTLTGRSVMRDETN